ncbi:hypothetical protein A2V61_01385 [Candidatus Woesebacteria bacterium RBG_19FT_COMBO_47_8]|nr:MAG: hypothetical protein A2V61_01385 [Candidatus Woesebacteria bacterium RBG_19FT_COMBO_47_8]
MKLSSKYSNFIIYLLIVLLSLAYFSFFLNKGLTLYDEGYIVESSYLTYLGKIPYKDFYFQYTPLTAWVGTIVFKIFGVGILKLRWLALVISLATVLLGYEITKELAGKKNALLIALALIAWGFPHANFLWPSSLSLLFLLVTTLCFIRYSETKNLRYFSLAGIAVWGNILTKQNLGTVSLVTSIVFILLICRGRLVKGFLHFLIPFIAIAGVSLSIILLSNPDFTGIKELFFRSLMAARGQTLYSPYPMLSKLPSNLGEIFKWVIKTYLYLTPIFFITILGLSLFIKRSIKPLLVGIFISSVFHFLLVVWPTADLAHFTFGVPCVLLVFMVATLVYKGPIRKFALLSIFLFILIGFYKTLFMSYYTFETPYLRLRDPVTIRGETIIVDEKYKTIVDFLNDNKDGLFVNRSIFVYSYAPMVYFILDKEPPTRELYTVENLLSKEALVKVVEDLGQAKTDLVLLETWREKDSDITRLIRQNYRKIETVWDFEILARK